MMPTPCTPTDGFQLGVPVTRSSMRGAPRPLPGQIFGSRPRVPPGTRPTGAHTCACVRCHRWTWGVWLAAKTYSTEKIVMFALTAGRGFPRRKGVSVHRWRDVAPLGKVEHRHRQEARGGSRCRSRGCLRVRGLQDQRDRYARLRRLRERRRCRAACWCAPRGVLVSAVEGVEVQTEMVWRMADELGLPRADLREQVDRERVLSPYRRRVRCRLQLPIGDEADFHGVVEPPTTKPSSTTMGTTGRAPRDGGRGALRARRAH